MSRVLSLCARLSFATVVKLRLNTVFQVCDDCNADDGNGEDFNGNRCSVGDYDSHDCNQYLAVQ